MRLEHIAPITPIIDEVEASALKAKAETLWTKHQKQQSDNVSLADRFLWTDKDVANAFVRAYGGKITSKHATIPWRLLYCRNGEFVAYVKEYKIETPESHR